MTWHDKIVFLKFEKYVLQFTSTHGGRGCQPFGEHMIALRNVFWPVFVFLNSSAHVLLHFVKSSCLNSANPFSTPFSADIQHNCLNLLCICRTYFPLRLAFRFFHPKVTTSSFSRKVTPSAILFWTNEFFSQIYSDLSCHNESSQIIPAYI